MSSVSLLWNCALRTIIWGASLGTAYGGIAAPLGLMIAGILYARMGALSVNPFLGVPAGMLPGIPLGIIAGATLGFVAGTVLGVINGSLLCALTYFYLLRTKDAVAYRRAARIACSLVTVAVLATVWVVLGPETNSFVGGGPAGTIEGGVAYVVLLEIGPIVVAAWAAQLIGKRVADWCSSRAPEGGAERS